jgi:chemotaxis protein methyltransferase CheR
MNISHANLEVLISYIYEQSGIVLTKEKDYLIEARLTPLLKKHSLSDLNHLVEKIKSKDAGICCEIIEAMTTNESSFFRDMKPFDYLRDVLLPELINKHPEKNEFRIWCAACSNGQEPYSIAMLLKEHPLSQSKNFSITATDIDTHVLDTAKNGIYTQFEVQRGVPVPMLMKYFSQYNTDWQIKDELKRLITFKQLNLMQPCENLGHFDVIFCRNVLIYFDQETKSKVLHRIKECMEPDGTLFLGATETLIGMDTGLVSVSPPVPGVYIRG